jgi:hypothetical protein
MKTNIFSVVVGDSRCNASCPFCVAKMTGSNFSDCIEFDERRFNVACQIAEQMRNGLLTVILTGQGEPLLFTKQITRYLQCIDFRFPLIGLQTNGILVEKNLDNFRQWKDEGLTTVCLSIASGDHKVSNGIMGINSDYNYWNAAAMLQEIGLNVRLNCTMTKVGTYKPRDCENIILRANNAGILQTTFREVTMPDPCYSSSIGAWVGSHSVEGAAKRLHHYLALNGAVRLMELPHGGVVYDYKDQNVAIGNCLTDTTNPDDIRQVIFFPDGRVAYDWRYKAARLL